MTRPKTDDGVAARRCPVCRKAELWFDAMRRRWVCRACGWADHR